MIKKEFTVAIAKLIQSKKFKIKKRGNYFIVNSPQLSFGIHKSLFKRVENSKKLSKIEFLINEYANLIVV